MMPTAVLRLLLLPLLTVAFAARDAGAVELDFTLYGAGVPVAESTMTIDLSPATYGMGLRYHTIGLASVFNADSIDQYTNGTLDRDQPAPVQFRSLVKLHGRDRTVTLGYRDGNPTIAAINPPNEGEREIVPPALREHTFDPLTAIVDILEVASRTGRCDLNHYTYDGRRREMFQARTVGEEDIPPSSRSVFSGRALRCDYSTQPVAGLRIGEGREEDARVRKGTFWLAPVKAGGPRLPVQGLVDVRFLGTATMYLTAIKP
jgi:hypothetical protein